MIKHEENVKIRLGNHKGKTLKELEAISNEYNEKSLQAFRDKREQS